jgi:hypothetical protein
VSCTNIQRCCVCCVGSKLRPTARFGLRTQKCSQLILPSPCCVRMLLASLLARCPAWLKLSNVPTALSLRCFVPARGTQSIKTLTKALLNYSFRAPYHYCAGLSMSVFRLLILTINRATAAVKAAPKNRHPFFAVVGFLSVQSATDK